MADRRYKLIKQGLPGGRSFELGDLAEGQTVYWDNTNKRWVNNPNLTVYTDNQTGIDISSGAVRIRGWDSSDTDIDGLIGGSTFGGLMEGQSLGHMVVGIRGNDAADAFVVVGTDDGDDVYDTLMIVARAGGDTDLYSNGQKMVYTESSGYGLAINGPSSTSSGIRLRDNANSTMGYLGFILGDKISIRNEKTSGEVIIYGRDAADDLHTCANFDPDGNVDLYSTDNHVFSTIHSTAGGGIRLIGDATNDRQLLEFYNRALTTRVGFLWSAPDLNKMELRNEVDGDLLYIAGTSSTTRNMIVCDPGGEVDLYDAGTKAVGTVSGGAALYAASAAGNINLRFKNSSGTDRCLIYFAENVDDVVYDIQATSGRHRFFSDDSGSVQRELLALDPDGPALTCNTAAGGIVVGAPTGGDKGSGTINAKSVYDDNVLLTCLPVEEAVGTAQGRGPWDRIFPAGRNTLVDQYEADKARGLDGTAAGWVKLMEAHGSVPGLPNRQELEARWHSKGKVRVKGMDSDEDILVDDNDKMGLAEVSNRQWLALDYMAVALRDSVNTIEALQERLTSLEAQVEALRDPTANDKQTPPAAP